jgi:hypothetical protein
MFDGAFYLTQEMLKLILVPLPQVIKKILLKNQLKYRFLDGKKKIIIIIIII